MEILIESRDNYVSKYTVQDIAYSTELMASIRPSELFHQPHLRVQSGKLGSIFIMNEVEVIRFVTPIRLKNELQPPMKEFHTIPEEVCMEEMEKLRTQYEPLNNLFLPGNTVETLFAVHCVSGRVCYLKAQIVVGHRLEQTLDMRTRLERLTAMIPCSDGYLAINPLNITKIEMYPAPPLPDHAGWLVD